MFKINKMESKLLGNLIVNVNDIEDIKKVQFKYHCFNIENLRNSIHYNSFIFATKVLGAITELEMLNVFIIKIGFSKFDLTIIYDVLRAVSENKPMNKSSVKKLIKLYTLVWKITSSLNDIHCMNVYLPYEVTAFLYGFDIHFTDDIYEYDIFQQIEKVQSINEACFSKKITIDDCYLMSKKIIDKIIIEKKS